MTNIDGARFPLDLWLDVTATSMPYHPRLASALTPSGALLFVGMMSATPDDEGWVDLDRDFCNRIGFTGSDLGRAREALARVGVIDHEGEGVKVPRVRVNFNALLMLLDSQRQPRATKPKSKTPKQQELPASTTTTSLTVKAVLRGDVDGLPKTRLLHDVAVLEVLHDLWCDQWGRRRGKPSVPNRRAWQSAVRGDVKPSEWAKAIVGMRCDDWPDRRRHNGWSLVLKHIDKWLDNYEAFRAGRLRKPDLVEATSFESKVVEGVTIPVGYQWTRDDSQARAFGHRFDPVAQEWVTENDERFEGLAKYNRG